MNAVNINYDELLVGQTDYIDTNNFYGVVAGGQTQREAVSCIRYALETLLQWTPDDVIKKFDEYTIRIMKLDQIIRHIVFPPEIPYGNPRYILSLLYPQRIKIDARKMTESILESVLGAEFDDDLALKQFPREYFSGGDGFIRFCICVTYLIENYKPMNSVEEIYDFFDSPRGKKFLYDFRLRVPADQYAISMLEVIHYITREEEDGEFMYNFYKFSELYKKYTKQMLNKDPADDEVDIDDNKEDDPDTDDVGEADEEE